MPGLEVDEVGVDVEATDVGEDGLRKVYVSAVTLYTGCPFTYVGLRTLLVSSSLWID